MKLDIIAFSPASNRLSISLPVITCNNIVVIFGLLLFTEEYLTSIKLAMHGFVVKLNGKEWRVLLLWHIKAISRIRPRFACINVWICNRCRIKVGAYALFFIIGNTMNYSRNYFGWAIITQFRLQNIYNHLFLGIVSILLE